MTQVIGVLARALDASAMRQKAISNNIANVDTPHFKPARVEFEEILKKQLGNSTFVGNRTNDKHITIGKQGTVPSPSLVKQATVMKNNGNGVDLDYEMTEMAQNSVWYQSLTYGINAEFDLLKTAIKRG